MLCPRHARAVDAGPTLPASCRTWLRPFTGLLLAVGGFSLVAAGMSVFTTPVLPPREAEPVARAMNQPEDTPPAPLRLEWAQARPDGWRNAPEGVAPRSGQACPCGEDDLAAASGVVERVANGAPSQPATWIGSKAMGRSPVSPFGGWDPRLALAEMARDQHRLGRPQCPCPMLREGMGNR